jgi:hypothetical protein
MSEETQSESADMDMEVELPPVLVQFLNAVRADQKRLLKDKSFANADQLRKFVSLNLMERFIQAVEMLGTTALDLQQLGVSNATQLQRMRRWTAKHLRKLGAEVSDGEAFAGIGTEQVDALGQAFYALGSHLQVKYPNDKDTEARFNDARTAYNQLVEALMGDQSEEDDDEEDEEEEEDPETAAEAAVDPEAAAEAAVDPEVDP